MTEIINLPPVMGMFFTGYVLHRAWWFWYERRILRQIRNIELMQISFEIERMQNVVWKAWSPALSATEGHGK